MWNRFKTLDPLLFIIPLLLIGVSVVMIYGLTALSVGPTLAMRQGLYAGIGLLGMILLTFFDYRNFKGLAPWIYLGGLAALVAVEIFGKEVFGAKRWVDLAFFQFQPGEIEKGIVILVLAAVLAHSLKKLSFQRFIFSLILLVIPVAAVLQQPDLGTALVILVAGLTVLLHARLSKLQWILGIVAICAFILSILFSFKGVAPFNGLLKDYQKDRLISFIEPNRDTAGSGYNVLQSKIAVGSGGLMGRGIGSGSQSQLHFLPVAHADFIFAGIGETWGLVGAFALVTLYVVLIFRVLNAAKIAKDTFGMLVAVGIAAKLLFEVLVNIGMNIGLMPVTGIPLPFVSYGGTTMITNLLLIGIAQSIVIRYKRLTF